MSTRSARTSSNFNPRSSCEERLRLSCSTYSFPYFNPRSSCEERLHGRGWQRHRHFNPRSSCEERPNGRFSRAMRVYYFNPRSSCEERRPVPSASRHSMRFQSTLLMRGATRRPIRVHKLERNFNPRSSCEERLAMVASSSQAAEISIHAPHARSDERDSERGHAGRRISIHAPHARSDIRLHALRFSWPYFNPRSSCEERHPLFFLWSPW